MIQKTFQTLLLFIFFNIKFSNAQIIKGEIGINGLTCSQCSNSTYKQLLKIPFITNIEMDLDETKARFNFKQPNLNVNLYSFYKAVDDAAYSLRNLLITIDPTLNKSVSIDNNYLLKVNNIEILLDKEVHLDKIFTIELVGKKFNADKKKNNRIPKSISNSKILYGIVQ